MTTESKNYSTLGADLTLAAEAISRARIAVFKASDPDELRHAVRRSEDAEETLTQILSRRGVIRCIYRASLDAIADIRAFADIRRGDCAIYTAPGNNGDIEIRYIVPFSFGSPAAREHAENKLREALCARGYEVVNAAADGRDWTAELRAVRKD